MFIRFTHLVVLSLLTVWSTVVWAADPQLEKSGAPPDSLAAALKDQLQPTGLKIQVDGKVLGEFWMRKELPTAEGSNPGLGIHFTGIQDGTFAGVVQFPESWKDYKGQPVPAGVYSLRYGIEPADGNHMGVSTYRDFLILVPVAEDKDPSAKYTTADLVKLSTKASGTNHPAVLALFPVYDEVTEPKLYKNDSDQWTLAVPFGPTRLGVVLIGQGAGV
jgi:hypothetical protein